MFRDPSISLGFDRPSDCLGIRSFIVDYWNFRSGVMGNWGLRIVGVCLEVQWRWMNPSAEHLWMLSSMMGGGEGAGNSYEDEDAEP